MTSVFSTSLSGMQAATVRLASAASNIANASSTGKLPSADNPEATSFLPKDVITTSNNAGGEHLGVSTTLVPRDPAYSSAYDPRSQDANKDGFVAAPNVDIAEEILDAMMARLAYQASSKVISVEKDRQETLLDTLS